MWGNPLGDNCHWCGKRVTAKRYPKSGNHLFCCNAHKMAHARAFAKWQKNSVTQAAPAGSDLVKRDLAKSNARKPRQSDDD